MKKILVLVGLFFCAGPIFAACSFTEVKPGVLSIKNARKMNLEGKEYFCCQFSTWEECKTLDEWLEWRKNQKDEDLMGDLREVDLSSRYSMSDEKVDFDKQEKKSLGSKILGIILYPVKLLLGI